MNKQQDERYAKISCVIRPVEADDDKCDYDIDVEGTPNGIANALVHLISECLNTMSVQVGVDNVAGTFASIIEDSLACSILSEYLDEIEEDG